MIAVAHLNFVERTVHFFSVTGNERNRAPLIYKTDNRADLLYANVQLLGNSFHNFNFIDI